MILTVTLNAALDVTYRVSRLEIGQANRVDEVQSRAGGKGINVARILNQLGAEATATGFAGGETGARIRADLDAAGIRDRMVAIEGESRRTVTAVQGGEFIEFDEPGPPVSEGEWQRFRNLLPELLRDAQAVVLSGSLPPGLAQDSYRDLCREAARQGCPAVLDTGGEPLKAALEAAPALVKPNQRELAMATDTEPEEGSAWAAGGAQALRRLGPEAVVVSLGEGGLVAVTGEGSWRAVAPRVAGNPVGAGDAVVAALTQGLVTGLPWPERLRRAAALGAAAVLIPVGGSYDPEGYAWFLKQVNVEAL